MTDRLVIYEYRWESSTQLNRSTLAEALSELNRSGWEVVQLTAADKSIPIVSMENLYALLRKPRPHPAPPRWSSGPGWYDDPLDGASSESDRYWDGAFWTVHTRVGQWQQPSAEAASPPEPLYAEGTGRSIIGQTTPVPGSWCGACVKGSCGVCKNISCDCPGNHPLR